MEVRRSWKVKDLGVLQHRHHQGGAVPANPQQGTHLTTADLPHYLTTTMGFSPFGLYVGADLLLLRAVKVSESGQGQFNSGKKEPSSSSPWQ